MSIENLRVHASREISFPDVNPFMVPGPTYRVFTDSLY